METFDSRLCGEKHTNIDRRLGTLEESLNVNFQRVYDKVETQTLIWAEKATENARRPGWAALTLISILSTISGGLAIFLLTKGH
uniref:Uncharacterized protein n=1 Tax=viral metagenome TaxID=1070528 RepID=A0A6M3XVQ8_9ZZZZ